MGSKSGCQIWWSTLWSASVNQRILLKSIVSEDVFAEQRNRSNTSNNLLQMTWPNQAKSWYQEIQVCFREWNVIDAHVYQIKGKICQVHLVESFGWVLLKVVIPHVPFYGLVNDTYGAFKVRSAKYDPTSWYWLCLAYRPNGHEISRPLWHKYQRINGKEMEAGWIKEQAALNQKYEWPHRWASQSPSRWSTKESMDRADVIFKTNQGYWKGNGR